MKSFMTLFTVGLLSIGATACGSSDKRITSNSPASSAATTSASTVNQDYAEVDKDADNDHDIEGASDDTDNGSTLNFGRPASAADKQKITALVERYYAAAAADNGAQACSMLPLTLSESVGEDYGKGSAGPSYLSSGTTCPAVMTLLFEHSRAQLLTEVPQLRVTRVRLQQHHGIAILTFGKLPMRKIAVQREGPVWKVENLLDSELP